MNKALGTPLLKIEDLHVWFPVRRGIFSRVRGYVKAVQGVSLEIEPGEVVGLVGESGCGKSTLARSVMMLQPPEKGRVELQGRDLYRASIDEQRRARRAGR